MNLRRSRRSRFATLEIAFGVTPKAKIEERSAGMPLRQIDAASQRSAPSFSAILTRSATDFASIFRMKIAGSGHVDRKNSPQSTEILAVLLLIGDILSTLQMAKDIFPAINIPVVGIIWSDNGLPAQEMAERITTVSERTSTTNGIRRRGLPDQLAILCSGLQDTRRPYRKRQIRESQVATPFRLHPEVVTALMKLEEERRPASS